MYVPGKFADTKNVILDIGTRYYVQKVSKYKYYFIITSMPGSFIKDTQLLCFSIIFQDIDSAKDYFKRKTAFVTEQMEKIQILGLQKSRIRDTIVEVMEMKLQTQAAQS